MQIDAFFYLFSLTPLSEVQAARLVAPRSPEATAVRLSRFRSRYRS